MKKVTIVDYGSSNLRSVAKAIEARGAEVEITSSPSDIAKASVVVLPGQGAFKQAMEALSTQHLIDPIKTHIASQKPYLGICLGFQILFEESEEHGHHTGLGIFKGKITHFKNHLAGLPINIKIPHMGWNTLDIKSDPQHILSSIGADAHAYFVHSYALFDTDPSIICTTTTYGVPFVSSIQTNTVFASQFHPEKSGHVGQQLLSNFLKIHAS